MEIAIFWIILCFVAGTVGNGRKIGFAGVFFLSLFLSPLVGLIIAFNSDKLENKYVAIKLSSAMIKLIKEGDKFANSGSFEKAIEKYKSALTYTNKAPMTNFKLAKLYSLKKESKSSLKYLAMSIQAGFKNFDKINDDEDLAYLRGEAEFNTFVENGYKILSVQTETMRPLSRTEELEKLHSLFKEGVLTKKEFENEKKIILS